MTSLIADFEDSISSGFSKTLENVVLPIVSSSGVYSVLVFANEEHHHTESMKHYCKDIKKSLDMYVDVKTVKFNIQVAVSTDEWYRDNDHHHHGHRDRDRDRDDDDDYRSSRHYRRFKEWFSLFKNTLGNYLTLNADISVTKYRHFETDFCDRVVNGRIKFDYVMLSPDIQTQKLDPLLQDIFSSAKTDQNGVLLKKLAVATENANLVNISSSSSSSSATTVAKVFAALNELTVARNFGQDCGVGAMDNLTILALKLSLATVKSYRLTYSSSSSSTKPPTCSGSIPARIIEPVTHAVGPAAPL